MLKATDFVLKQRDYSRAQHGSFTWKSPSNIALIKYWGKKENQIPANPSLSFTLDVCHTVTTLEFKKKKRADDALSFELLFEGSKQSAFTAKVNAFWNRVLDYAPYLTAYDFVIKTRNSFPHSSGIASSASGMSALALCMMSLEKQLNPDISEVFFKQKASFLARLGSGSACRSIEGAVVSWGRNAVENSSDLYGVEFPYEIHPKFENYHDTILLIDKGQKQVSSSTGHDLMQGHPFAVGRLSQAHAHFETLKESLITGDMDRFIEVVESEALSLHALMMSSQPYYVLMHPNTLAVIQKVWKFRKQTGLHLCFTLDAGANVHLLYPQHQKEVIRSFIQNELVVYCEKGHYICDRVGKGAIRINDA